MLAVLAGATAPARQAVPTPDPVVQLLTSLQSAMVTNSVSAVRALEAPELPTLDGAGFEVSLLQGQITSATIRERDREAVAGGVRILAEFLVTRQGAGQIPTSPLRASISAMSSASSPDDGWLITMRSMSTPSFVA